MCDQFISCSTCLNSVDHCVWKIKSEICEPVNYSYLSRNIVTDVDFCPFDDGQSYSIESYSKEGREGHFPWWYLLGILCVMTLLCLACGLSCCGRSKKKKLRLQAIPPEGSPPVPPSFNASPPSANLPAYSLQGLDNQQPGSQQQQYQYLPNQYPPPSSYQPTYPSPTAPPYSSYLPQPGASAGPSNNNNTSSSNDDTNAFSQYSAPFGPQQQHQQQQQLYPSLYPSFNTNIQQQQQQQLPQIYGRPPPQNYTTSYLPSSANNNCINGTPFGYYTPSVPSWNS